MEKQDCALVNLPFYNLSDIEFNALTGNWQYVFSSDADIYDVLHNPDKFDERDSDLMLSTPNSNYYSLTKLNQLLNNCSHDTISLLHFNIKSLPKNVSILNYFLYTFDNIPDVLAITETKLNDNNVANIDLLNYNFYHTDSPTMAGSAGLYMRKDLQAIHRPDIKFNIPLVESCWSEIITGRNRSSIVVGCIYYRHPSANIKEFTSELKTIIKQLKNDKYEVFILGVMNIDFLKYNIHANTEQYLDMLYLDNLIPVITKPARISDHSSTLIDHIYTNVSIQKVVFGIALVDISDHLPTFSLYNTSICRSNKTIYLRDFSQFYQKRYVNDLNKVNWSGMFNTQKNLHEITDACINTVTQIIDKHAPMKQASQSRMKELSKPWLSKGLIKFIKVKQKLYHTHFLSKDPFKISKYKSYSNALNKLKTKAKNNYYNQQFLQCKNNLKTTWKLIGTLINRKSKGHIYPIRVKRNDKMFTNPSDTAE